MPSKRKKNKRRMRRVQAQRRALEDQHAANLPVKASPGIAVSAPPAATPKKVAKTPAPAPEKIPEAVPISVPIVETPKVEPEPEPVVIEPVAEPIPVEVDAPEPEAVLLEQTPVEVEVPSPVIETPPAEPSIVEAAIIQEAEPIIPETEPVTEVIPPTEAPVAAPVETKTQTEETTIRPTETEQVQTHNVCEPETKVEAEALTEEDAPLEAEVEAAVTEATEEPVVEAFTSDEVSAEAEPASDKVVTETVVESVVEEVIAEIPEPEQVTEAIVSPAAPDDDDPEVKVLAEEDAPEVPAEPVTLTEDAPAQAMEIPLVPVTVPEALAEEAKAPVIEVNEAPATQEPADSLVDDFVVAESASAVGVAIAESAAVEPETSDTLNTQIESVHVMSAEPESAAAPAEEMVIDATAEQTCPDVLSEEPKSEICDMPCQMQLAVESVQISSMEVSIES